MKGERTRTIMVYVDSYHDGILRGRVARACDRETRPFQSLCELLKIVEHSLDTTKYPQSFEKLRVFGEPRCRTVRKEQEHNHKQGELATFAIRILFRQNASWQGSVFWPEGKLEESFRSVLELIFLMDSALHYSSNPGKGATPIYSS